MTTTSKPIKQKRYSLSDLSNPSVLVSMAKSEGYTAEEDETGCLVSYRRNNLIRVMYRSCDSERRGGILQVSMNYTYNNRQEVNDIYSQDNKNNCVINDPIVSIGFSNSEEDGRFLMCCQHVGREGMTSLELSDLIHDFQISIEKRGLFKWDESQPFYEKKDIDPQTTKEQEQILERIKSDDYEGFRDYLLENDVAERQEEALDAAYEELIDSSDEWSKFFDGLSELTDYEEEDGDGTSEDEIEVRHQAEELKRQIREHINDAAGHNKIVNNTMLQIDYIKANKGIYLEWDKHIEKSANTYLTKEGLFGDHDESKGVDDISYAWTHGEEEEIPFFEQERRQIFLQKLCDAMWGFKNGYRGWELTKDDKRKGEELISEAKELLADYHEDFDPEEPFTPYDPANAEEEIVEHMESKNRKVLEYHYEEGYYNAPEVDGVDRPYYSHACFDIATSDEHKSGGKKCGFTLTIEKGRPVIKWEDDESEEEEDEELGEILGLMEKLAGLTDADPEGHNDLKEKVKELGTMTDDLIQGRVSLEGKTVVISGDFKEITGLSQSEVKEALTKAGATIGSSVTKKTELLIQGDGIGSKNEKAKELNIPIVTWDMVRPVLVTQ